VDRAGSQRAPKEEEDWKGRLFLCVCVCLSLCVALEEEEEEENKLRAETKKFFFSSSSSFHKNRWIVRERERKTKYIFIIYKNLPDAKKE
jgi:hypothetical protein